MIVHISTESELILFSKYCPLLVDEVPSRTIEIKNTGDTEQNLSQCFVS
jgi:hypothetical protein